MGFLFNFVFFVFFIVFIIVGGGRWGSRDSCGCWGGGGRGDGGGRDMGSIFFMMVSCGNIIVVFIVVRGWEGRGGEG